MRTPWLALILLAGCATAEPVVMKDPEFIDNPDAYGYVEIDGVLTENPVDSPERQVKYTEEMQKTYKVLGMLGGGSGWAIDSRHVVTAKHVVHGNPIVFLKNCEGAMFGLQSIVELPDIDVALITMAEDVVPFALGAPPQPDDALTIYGWPALVHVAASHGTMFGWATPDFLVFDGTIISGMSGGPILDKKGRVVGMATATTDNKIGRAVGFALPIDLILEKLNALEQPAAP